MRPLRSGGLLPRSRSGASRESRPSLAEDLADVDDDDLVTAKVDDDDLAEVGEDDLAKVDDDDLVSAKVDDDDLAEVEEDDLAEVTAQGGLETGLLRCCQPRSCRSVAGLAVTGNRRLFGLP